MASDSKKTIEPINSLQYLEQLLEEGCHIRGPRLRKNPDADSTRDLASFKGFLRQGKEFAPEDWLSTNGYQFVEPNKFTKGHRIAYKMIDDFPDERFNSNYSIVQGDREIVLYLKAEIPDLEE